jgi:hypothetical protein
LPEGIEKNEKKKIIAVGVPAEIRTEKFPDASPGCYF